MTSGNGPAAKPSATACPIAEMAAGFRVESQVFRITQKDLRTTSNGELYVHAVVADATGQMLARHWKSSQQFFDSLPEGGFARFRGRVENYKGNRQFIVDGVQAVDERDVDPRDFLPASRRDAEQMWNRLQEILRTIEDRDLLQLVGRFMHDQAFVRGFQSAPAAITNHHAYLGGLLEHTLNLLELADRVLPLYPRVNRDLVLVGLFLHDCGKVEELEYRTNFSYSSAGQLVGHIAMAVVWVKEKIREIERETGQPFPENLALGLQHIILAHHGKYEFGSPRLPATAEAFVVHYLDNLDAKLNMVFEAVDADPDAASDWTSYVRALETRIFKPGVMGPSTENA